MQRKGDVTMNRRGITRSVLKFVGALVLLVAASSTDARAAQTETWCETEAAACAQMCGTTVNWGTLWEYYNPCYYYIPQLDLCIGRIESVEGVIFSSGLHNFECDEYPIGSSWCQCAY
jgi:hypothetical protein